MEPIDMPQTQPTAPHVLRLHREDDAPAAGPMELAYEAYGRVVIRLWTAAQWSMTPEASRPRTATETADGGWVDLAPATPPA